MRSFSGGEYVWFFPTPATITYTGLRDNESECRFCIFPSFSGFPGLILLLFSGFSILRPDFPGTWETGIHGSRCGGEDENSDEEGEEACSMAGV